MQAATAVATAVKVFPVAAAVGVASLQARRSPLLQILLIATSNVMQENVWGLLGAGVIGVGAD
jgi:2-keto-3-deoxy-6-phosphogluconate aldolase